MSAGQGYTLVYDIEVAGYPWEEVDEITRGYLLAREKDADRRAAVPDRTGLYPGLGRVVAIGIWLVEANRGLLLLEGDEDDRDQAHEDDAARRAEPGFGEHDWAKVPDSKIFRGDERALLSKFWDIVTSANKARRAPRLVTYNGRSYDGPMLMIRSAQLGVPARRDLVGYRYDISEHCDLMDALDFHGSRWPSYSLDYWCRRFDVESPKGSIDGSQVARAYRDGRIEDIGEYCLRDVRATAALYRKLEPTILPLFKGGPRRG
ncbi:MAG: ribonuclease H-like domain-containing protein [Planctomycetota bacterium]